MSLVGIDVGTTAVKAVAISPSGDVLGRAEVPLELSTPRAGWSEQDPEAWWAATETALGRLDAPSVAGIGLSGQMHGLVALDSQQRVLRPAILWNDQRTARECQEIEERVGRERLVELTGNSALTGFTAPKVLWMRKHEPHLWEHAATVLLPKDYVRLRLTGERAIDVADASGTLLFDVARRRWSGEVLDALEIDRALLPRVLESVDVSGHTADGVPVAAGAGDQAAGALGVGVEAPGLVSIALGTSGVVFSAMDGFAADPQARLHTFCHAVPETWHAMGVMLSAAGSLRWLRDVTASGGSFDELVAEAALWPPGAEGASFAPYLSGERTPHADPEARGAFTGLSARHDRGALARAVLEGVAYGLRDSLELLGELGLGARAGRISGGGARSGLWTRIIATVLGLPLERTEVGEGAAYGAALLAGVAAGEFSSAREAVQACVRVRDTIEPDAAWRDAYESGYARFKRLYPALRALREGRH